MSVQLYCGDCIEYMSAMPDNSVDAILTDPPYPREFAGLYGAIAQQAARVLRRGGSLLAIVPQYLMPQVMADVGAHLKWRWLWAMWQAQGTHPRMAMGVEVMYKPIGWWVKEAYPTGRGFVRDGFENEPPVKSLHKWQQSLTWAEACLKVTREGDTVLDPLMGAGTMGVACVHAGRNFIGCELDPDTYTAAERRITEELSNAQNNHD